MKKSHVYKSSLLFLLLAISLMGCQDQRSDADVTMVAPDMSASEAKVFAQFEAELEYLRQTLNIPGMSAAIVQDQELVWAKGFGYADLENQVEATPDTPYHLASVTKPFAATLVMQLVEEGALDLDEPATQYGIDLNSPGVVQVRHLLTHTSEGTPGSRYQYNGDRFALLSAVIEQVAGKSFRELLREEILSPLDMTNTAPNYVGCDGGHYVASLAPDDPERSYAHVYQNLTRPYQIDPSYNVVRGENPSYFNAAAGLISTVVDLAKFDIAIDQNVLLSRETKEQMFTPTVSTRGAELPYGLGWFTQRYKGVRLIWHYGFDYVISSLMLKVPDENITFIILANSSNLSRPYRLGDGDVLESAVALAFLRTFVFQPQHGQPLLEIDWEADVSDLANQLQQTNDEDLREIYERELWSYRQVFASVGRWELVERLLDVHEKAYPDSGVSGRGQYLVGRPGPVSSVGEGINLSEEELARFIGQYRLRDETEVEDLPLEFSIELWDDKLIATDPNEGCIILIPTTPTLFRIPSNPDLSLEVTLNEDVVENATLKLGGTPIAVYDPEE